MILIHLLIQKYITIKNMPSIIQENEYIILYSIYIMLTSFICFLFFKNYPKIAKNLNLIDNQNINYNFKPTPTGSGIIFSICFIIGNCYFYFLFENFINLLPNRYYFLVLGMFALSILSFHDDRKSIDPILRLIIQALVIYFSITCLQLNKTPLPFKLTILLALTIWIYIINITNFMDGSDGFCSINIIFIFLNILLIGLTLPNIFSPIMAMILLPAVIVFFIFNMPPAKIYMGDAGSIGLGFIIGFIFLELLTKNYYGLAISLLSYFLCDCTLALLKKTKRGIMPWVGLYDYFYLIPTLKKKINHKNVLLIIISFNVLNSLIIFVQLIYGLHFIFIASVIAAFCTMYIFKNLEKKFSFLKFYKN